MDQLIEGAGLLCIYLFPLFGVLTVGGIISDYVLPRCPRLLRALEKAFDIDLGGFDYDD